MTETNNWWTITVKENFHLELNIVIPTISSVPLFLKFLLLKQVFILFILLLTCGLCFFTVYHLYLHFPGRKKLIPTSFLRNSGALFLGVNLMKENMGSSIVSFFVTVSKNESEQIPDPVMTTGSGVVSTIFIQN